jgi:hypothetical protein
MLSFSGSKTATSLACSLSSSCFNAPAAVPPTCSHRPPATPAYIRRAIASGQPLYSQPLYVPAEKPLWEQYNDQINAIRLRHEIEDAQQQQRITQGQYEQLQSQLNNLDYDLHPYGW